MSKPKKSPATFTLKVENGCVTFQMRTGNDLVQNYMSEAAARGIIETGTVTNSDRPGFEICVNDTYFFPTVIGSIDAMRPSTQIAEKGEV